MANKSAKKKIVTILSMCADATVLVLHTDMAIP